jgi:hypothetical protein
MKKTTETIVLLILFISALIMMLEIVYFAIRSHMLLMTISSALALIFIVAMVLIAKD